MADVSYGGTPGGNVNPLSSMDPAAQAQWLYDNINSTISLPQWQAWAGKIDPTCPQGRPFRTDKHVVGGDQRECVETPDNCPDGTRAFGKTDCLPENDPKFAAADNPTGTAAPGAGVAAKAPGIGLQDLMGNLTFQRLYGSAGFGKPASPTQVGTGNLFNLGTGDQARVLEGGALQWGAAPGFQSGPNPELKSSITGGPTGLVQPTGLASLVNQMNRRKQGAGLPRTFTY
jgi:hypothetical protein